MSELLKYIYTVIPFAALAGGVALALWLAFGAHPTAVLARNSVTELMRRRALHLFLIFVVLAIALGGFFSFLSPGEEDRMIRDWGMALITILGMILAIFVGAYLIPPEIERRTVYTVLAKPVKRYQFVLGRYLGAVAVLGINVAVMALILLVVLYFKQTVWSPVLLLAAAVTFVAVSLQTALVLMLSTWASTIMSVLGGFIFWGLGSLQGTTAEWLSTHAERSTRISVSVLSKILPNLQSLDLRDAVVNGDPIMVNFVGKLIAYGVIYTAVVLVLAMMFFNEREV